MLVLSFFRPFIGKVDDDVFEPLTVYNRRNTAAKRKGKEKAVAEPLSCPPLERMRYLVHLYLYLREIMLMIGYMKFLELPVNMMFRVKFDSGVWAFMHIDVQ